MNRPATLQDNWKSETDPVAICSFDYEAIQKPTKPLIHQAARFLYIKHGRGTITIDGAAFSLIPDTLIAITPWKISEITEVSETLQFTKVVYDYHYLNFFLKGHQGSAEKNSDLLSFLSMEPVVYLDSVQAEYIDTVMEQLKAELGVESTRMLPQDKPMTQIYVTNKLVELIIMYRRYIMSARGEKDNSEKAATGNSILSYIYAHSSEKLSLGQVADVFFISQSTLAKQITEKTGSTFSNLLSGIRIEKASDYLIYTDLQLDEIAALTGFVDASHLSKHFMTQVGISPMKYRKIYRSAHTKYNRTDKDVAFSIMNCIFKSYREEELSAGKVAAQFGVSVREMNRLLLYYAEKNFETLLNHVRINHACELLSSTELLVIDVAFAVGYRNIKTFNMNFLKYKEMTPTQFRSRITLQKADGSETGGLGE
ncbi:MAG: helix-turn-helix transcriptional regulator [Oscillospiraceae bacterium]